MGKFIAVAFIVLVVLTIGYVVHNRLEKHDNLGSFNTDSPW